MNTIYNREDLLKQLEDALDLAGANPSRWPEASRARLSAFVESDLGAARLFAEAKALDRVLSFASAGAPRAGFEDRILHAASKLPQEPQAGSAQIIDFRPRRQPARPRRGGPDGRGGAFWAGAAMLAASLILGVSLGLAGGVVPGLQSLEFLASNDVDAGIAFSGSLFEPSELHDRGQL